MTPEDAEAAGVKDKDIVKLDIQSPNGRSLTFGDVVVRVSASYATAAHMKQMLFAQVKNATVK